jgi:hypothetical protein
MHEESTGMWPFLSGLSSNGGNCKTVEVMHSTLPQGNIGLVASLLAATLYNGMIGTEHQSLEYHINCDTYLYILELEFF